MNSHRINAVATLFAMLLALPAMAAEKTPQGPQEANGLVPGQGLFAPGEKSVSFLLREAGRFDQPSPERELLDSTLNRRSIAELLKEERNKNVRRGLIPPADKNSNGIKVRFDGIRFLKHPDDSNLAWVRLVGPINEVETKAPVAIAELLESDEAIPVQFKSVTRKTGVTVTIITDLKLKWENGDLMVNDTKGTFDFLVGRFSPARLLYSSDTDSVSLPDLVGKRVSENELPVRTLLEPEKL